MEKWRNCKVAFILLLLIIVLNKQQQNTNVPKWANDNANEGIALSAYIPEISERTPVFPFPTCSRVLPSLH